LDHLIRLKEERRGDGEAQFLRGLEVDDQLKLYGLLHRQVGGLGAFENFVRISGNSASLVDAVRPIRDKATNLHKLAALIHRREAALGREFYELSAVIQREEGRHRDQRLSALTRHGSKGTRQCLRLSHLHGLEPDGQFVGRGLGLLHVARRGLGVSARSLEECDPGDAWHRFLYLFLRHHMVHRLLSTSHLQHMICPRESRTPAVSCGQNAGVLAVTSTTVILRRLILGHRLAGRSSRSRRTAFML
jgi:hypothetical protein